MEELTQLEWMTRYLRRLAQVDHGSPECDDMDQAEDVWRAARGDVTPEEAADQVAQDNRLRRGAGTPPRP